MVVFWYFLSKITLLLHKELTKMTTVSSQKILKISRTPSFYRHRLGIIEMVASSWFEMNRTMFGIGTPNLSPTNATPNKCTNHHTLYGQHTLSKSGEEYTDYRNLECEEIYYQIKDTVFHSFLFWHLFMLGKKYKHTSFYKET